MTVEEVGALWQKGYDPKRFIAASPELARAVDMIESGFFSLGDPERYASVAEQLRNIDPYMVCADFDAYVAAMRAAAGVFRQPTEWARRALYNLVAGGAFSSDATIRAYAREIWDLAPIKAEIGDDSSAVA
jgi:starch phosphorylase